MRRRPTRARRTATCVAALVAASALLLAGCASDPLAEQFREGSGKNYIAGRRHDLESTRPTTAASRSSSRARPSTATPYDSADVARQVQVVNFWYAGCAPCRVEAPILEEVTRARTATT